MQEVRERNSERGRKKSTEQCPYSQGQRGNGWRPIKKAIEAEKAVTLANNDYTAVAAKILEGLGGKDNVTSIDNCITRLRLEIKDQALVDEKVIKSAGVAGVVRPGKNSVQVIVGTKVQFVADEFKLLCK